MRLTRPGATLLLLLVACSLALIRPGAAAAAFDPYTVAGIPAEATAANAVAAREQALTLAQREGLRQLLRRLTLPDAASRLPRVDGLRIETFVRSYEVASEKVAPTRYVVTLNVSYLPDQVGQLLQGAGVPYLDRKPDPVLVVPVLQGADAGLDLWGDANPWRAAWNAGVPSPLVELRLPLGDAGDVATLTPDQVLAGDAAAPATLGRRYGATSVLIARARPTGGSPPTAVAVEARYADPEEPFAYRDTLQAAPGEDEATLLSRAAERVAAAVEAAVKRRLIVPSSQVSAIEVAVPLADLSGWVQIRRTLTAVSEVRSVRVESFERSGARVSLGYAGDAGRLAAAMQRAGLSLVEENGGWQLRAAGGRGASPAPSSASPATP